MGFDVAPFALTTTTWIVPAVVVDVAGSSNVSCLSLTNVVVIAVPAAWTFESLVKPEPLTFTVAHPTQRSYT